MFKIININCCFAIILLYVMIITLILMIIIDSIIKYISNQSLAI